MKTIFGEDNFFDKEMAKFYKAQDEYVYNEMSMAIKTYMPTVVFDRDKLERWVKLCVKLDNIDNTDLINIATQKKFEELKDKLALTEKALELACEILRNFTGNCPYDQFNLDMPNDCDEQCEEQMKRYFCWDKYLVNRAKEMMKSE